MTLNFFNYFRYKRTYNTIKKSNYFDTAYYLFKYPDVRVDDIDPIKHYILNGAKERRNPSEAFDTDFYLSSYDDVHIEKINPLFHFIRFGRNEGRVAKKSYFQADSKKPFQKSEKELIVKADSRSKNDIYLSCWLRDKEHIHDVLIDLIEKLNGYGHSVVSVTHSKVLVEDKRLKSMNVAFNLVGTKLYEDENIVFEVPRRLEEELNSVFITRPIAIQKDAIKKFNIILPKAYNFWRKEFEVKSPKLVFVWGSTCEMSRLHIFLAKELNIPYLVLERGHFPKTISLETVGQYAYGGGQLLPQKISFDANFYKKYTDWVYGNTERAYSQYNQSKGISKVIHKAKQKAQKIILFIGVNDIGSGVAYQGRYNERHGNLFNASSDAFLALQKALQIVDEKALLIVKPHPVDRFDYSALENENMLYEKDSYINELIKLSDVCVTMSTTALAMVIIEQKPIVTLSLTDISGLGIAYEVDDTSSLTVKLRSALEQKNFEQKMLEGKKFITKLFSQKLFSNQDYDGLMQSTDDLAF
ncbi:MAG: hypothetical protein U9N49_05115, partial [Campylobacterota bacterium]|nr:hypothetical protein [Campylobacterota bacterium]